MDSYEREVFVYLETCGGKFEMKFGERKVKKRMNLRGNKLERPLPASK